MDQHLLKSVAAPEKVPLLWEAEPSVRNPTSLGDQYKPRHLPLNFVAYLDGHTERVTGHLVVPPLTLLNPAKQPRQPQTGGKGRE